MGWAFALTCFRWTAEAEGKRKEEVERAEEKEREKKIG